MSTLRLRASPPFRLEAVVKSHGWFQTAPFAWDPGSRTLHRVEALPGGPVRLAIRGSRAGATVTADRPLERAERALLVPRLRRMLQLDVDLTGFVEALDFDPALAADLTAAGAGRLLAGGSLWEDVVKAVCATNTLWSQAVVCIGRIAAWAGDGTFPTPAQVLAAGEDRLRAEARVGYRAPYLLAVARAAEDGTLAAIEAEADELDGDGLARRLAGLPGVGPSTAGFLCLLMGRFDRVVIDSATYRHAAAIWFGGRRPSRQEILDRVAPAGPWRGLALYWAMIRGWHGEVGLSLTS